MTFQAMRRCLPRYYQICRVRNLGQASCISGFVGLERCISATKRFCFRSTFIGEIIYFRHILFYFKMDSTETLIDKQSLLNERQTQVSFTTSLFKAYKNSYNASEEIEISIPPSRSMINPADLQLMFRPLVQYSADASLGLTQFQNAQRCLTAI